MTDAYVVVAVLGIIVVLIINYFIAQKGEYVAELKGYGKEIKAFSMCFWFGILGFIYVAALPDQIQQEQNLKIIKLLKKINVENNQNTDSNSN